MTTRQTQALELKGPLELLLPDGSKVRIRPGPYGKGVAVIPLQERSTPTISTAEPGGRGRPPRKSTLRLRDRLEADAKAGRLRESKEYVDWMMQGDETLNLAVARQIVYRERRRYAE